MLRDGGAGLRPRRPLADPGLRPARPRHRHERMAVRAVQVGRQPRARPRQGADLPGPRGGQATSAATSTSTATASRIAPIPARIPTARRLLHARHQPRPLRALHGGGQRLRRQHAAAAAKFETAKELRARADLRKAGQGRAPRRDLLRLDRSGDGRGARDSSRHEACTSTRCASAASRSRTKCSSSSADHEHVFVVEQNRDAQLRTLLVTRAASIPRSSSRCCTTTARRSPRASSSTRSRKAARRANARRRCTRANGDT